MAIQDTKMCECGCIVEERSIDTGEWWNYCNDCYEKDQDDDESEEEEEESEDIVCERIIKFIDEIK
jgi:hypothetical protein